LEREEVVTRGAAFAIRGYMEAGLDLVVEIGFWHPGARRMAAAVFEPFDAWLVGLRRELAEFGASGASARRRHLPGLRPFASDLH